MWLLRLGETEQLSFNALGTMSSVLIYQFQEHFKVSVSCTNPDVVLTCSHATNAPQPCFNLVDFASSAFTATDCWIKCIDADRSVVGSICQLRCVEGCLSP